MIQSIVGSSIRSYIESYRSPKDILEYFIEQGNKMVKVGGDTNFLNMYEKVGDANEAILKKIRQELGSKDNPEAPDGDDCAEPEAPAGKPGEGAGGAVTRQKIGAPVPSLFRAPYLTLRPFHSSI